MTDSPIDPQKKATWQTVTALGLVYATLHLAVYSTHTFSLIYFQSALKLSAWQIGLVAAVGSIQGAAALAWGWAADTFDTPRMLLTIACLLHALSFAPLLFDPLGMGEKRVWIKVLWGASWYTLGGAGASGLFPIVDSQAMRRLGGGKFGPARVFGAVGHAVGTAVSGLAIDRFGWWGMFGNLVISTFLFIISVTIFLVPLNENSTDYKPIVEQTTGMDNESADNDKRSRLVRLITPKFVFFAALIFTAGLMRCTLTIFLPLFMKNEMGRSAGLVAAVTVVRTGSEVAVYLLSGRIDRLLGGGGKAANYTLLIVAQVAGIFRTLAYAVLPTTGQWFYAAFAIELLKGLATGCVVTGGVRLAKALAPTGCEATAQAVYSSTYGGIAAAAAGLLGALLLVLFQGPQAMQRMFLCTSIMAAIATFIFILKFIIGHVHRKKRFQ